MSAYEDFTSRIQTITDSGRHYVLIVRKGRRGELGIRPPRSTPPAMGLTARSVRKGVWA